MNLEMFFGVASNIALPGWLLLVLAPGWRWGTQRIAPFVIPLILALMYAYLMVTNLANAQGDFASLAGVRGLFEVDALLLAGWIHYLAFDLFIGAWEVRDARRLGIPHLLVVPCLICTLMLGPIGLALYFALRGIMKRTVWIDDGVPAIVVAPPAAS
ncbi:MAG TPA: ABA4-like family protein [Pirellulales bacterium]|jgi:hypothetical protein